jgi:Uma2 family endonuclease
MATANLVPLSEYLETGYRPDREYIDGELRERKLGETEHSRLQALLIGFLLMREKQGNIIVLPEQRVQVTQTRYRVPDIVVVQGNSSNHSHLARTAVPLHRNPIS